MFPYSRCQCWGRDPTTPAPDLAQPFGVGLVQAFCSILYVAEACFFTVGANPGGREAHKARARSGTRSDLAQPFEAGCRRCLLFLYGRYQSWGGPAKPAPDLVPDLVADLIPDLALFAAQFLFVFLLSFLSLLMVSPLRSNSSLRTPKSIRAPNHPPQKENSTEVHQT